MTHLLSHLRFATALYLGALMAASMMGEFSLPVFLGAAWGAVLATTYFHYAKRYL